MAHFSGCPYSLILLLPLLPPFGKNENCSFRPMREETSRGDFVKMDSQVPEVIRELPPRDADCSIFAEHGRGGRRGEASEGKAVIQFARLSLGGGGEDVNRAVDVFTHPIDGRGA